MPLIYIKEDKEPIVVSEDIATKITKDLGNVLIPDDTIFTIGRNVIRKNQIKRIKYESFSSADATGKIICYYLMHEKDGFRSVFPLDNGRFHSDFRKDVERSFEKLTEGVKSEFSIIETSRFGKSLDGFGE